MQRHLVMFVITLVALRMKGQACSQATCPGSLLLSCALGCGRPSPQHLERSKILSGRSLHALFSFLRQPSRASVTCRFPGTVLHPSRVAAPRKWSSAALGGRRVGDSGVVRPLVPQPRAGVRVRRAHLHTPAPHICLCSAHEELPAFAQRVG